MRLGWVDYSREERNKIVSILKLLGTQEAVDELGIGTIRNYFSNILFPGITTQQTRAKYFVLIPYLFADAQKGKHSSKGKVLEWINKQEDALVKALMNTPDIDDAGIIGSRAHKQGRTVKLKPSTIYWSGLRAAGILRYPDLSISDACEIVYLKSKKLHEISLKVESDDTRADDRDTLYDGHVVFEPVVPDYDYKNDCSIRLEKKEAEYIHRQFTEIPETKNSLMAYLLTHEDVFENTDILDAIESELLPEPLRHHFELSRQFADFIYGAHVLYNAIYSEDSDDDVKDEFERWLSRGFYPIDLDSIIRESVCARDTGKFLYDFRDSIASGDIAHARRIVAERELYVKRDRAKLNKPTEYIYNPERRIHYYKLDYRYSTARRIIRDIYEGLGK